MKFWCRFGHDDPQQAVLSAQHVVPQVRVAQAAWQVPAEQVCPDEQVRPHTPQFATSFWRFTQLPLQSVSPLAQAREQAPPLQIWSAEQTFPQRPQLVGSVLVSVQIDDPAHRARTGGVGREALAGARAADVVRHADVSAGAAVGAVRGGVDARARRRSAGRTERDCVGEDRAHVADAAGAHALAQATPVAAGSAVRGVGLEVHAPDAARVGRRGGALAAPRRRSSSRSSRRCCRTRSAGDRWPGRCRRPSRRAGRSGRSCRTTCNRPRRRPRPARRPRTTAPSTSQTKPPSTASLGSPRRCPTV